LVTGSVQAQFGHGRGGGLLQTLFGPPPVETVFVGPPTTVTSTSVLVPTTTVVSRPARVSFRPTVYQTEFVDVTPTRFVVPSSTLTTTRYVINDGLMTTGFVSDGFVETIYEPVVFESAPVVTEMPVTTTVVRDDCIDQPAVSATPAPRDNQARRAGGQEPPLRQPTPSTQGQAQGQSGQSQQQPEQPGQTPSQSQDATGEEMPPPDSGLEGSPPELPEPPPANTNDFYGLPGASSREAMRPVFPRSTTTDTAAMVEGVVRDQATNDPIAGATVRFTNAGASGFEDRQATTNAQGRFQLSRFLPDGDWPISVTGPSADAETRNYPAITISGGRIYDQSGRAYSQLLLNY